MRGGKSVRKMARTRKHENKRDLGEVIDGLSVCGCLCLFALAYGWRATLDIWYETAGFVTNVERVLSEYPKKTDVPDEGIMRCVWVLRAYPDSETIVNEIDDRIYDEERYYYPDYDDTYSVDEVADEFGYVPTVDLERQEEEQRWIYVENASLYERVEAISRKVGDADVSTEPDGAVENSRGAKEYIDRGAAYCEAGDADSAIADFTAAISLDPNDPAAYYNRGVAYYKKDDYDSAVADCTAAISLDPNEPGAYYMRGIVYYKKGDYDSTVADCTAAIRLAPNEPGAYYMRGVVYYGKNDYDSAIADFTAAIRLDPNESKAYCARGFAYDEKGDLFSAIINYTQAIRLNPDYAAAYHNRGVAYEDSGDTYNAIADYTEALRLDPDNKDAEEAISRLSLL